MRLIESFQISKTGSLEDCEDRVAYNECFAYVIDGASSQCQRKWDGMSSGRFAALKIGAAIDELPPEIGLRDAVDHITEAIAKVYRKDQLLALMSEHPIERCAASFVMYRAHMRELWFVGDCQALLVYEDGSLENIQNPKFVDQVCSLARAMFVESELLTGKRCSELRSYCTGREYVQSLIDRQFLFQNSLRRSEFSYYVIDGFPVSDVGLKVVPIPIGVRSIVLGSDGFPRLFPTLQETELYRMETLRRDPLMIHEEKRVAPFNPANNSYDDRAYIRFQITEDG